MFVQLSISNLYFVLYVCLHNSISINEIRKYIAKAMVYTQTVNKHIDEMLIES
mgnify:CR=1 FL=1